VTELELSFQAAWKNQLELFGLALTVAAWKNQLEFCGLALTVTRIAHVFIGPLNKCGFAFSYAKKKI
jgi:hypothetical protein